MDHHGARDDGGRTHLIREALALLDDVHPEDLSIREVARRAGLSSGAPYHHFRTKTDLLAACAVVAWTDLCLQLEDDGAGGPRERLLRRATTYLAYARANTGSYRLITSRLFDDAQRFVQVSELRKRAIGGVTMLIVAASGPSLDQPTAKFLGVSMWSMLHGHLILGNAPSDPLESLAELDAVVARLATRMALLPDDSDSGTE